MAATQPFSDNCNALEHVNFILPVPPTLETSRVKLTPFVPSIHGEVFYAGYASSRADLERYLPISLPSYSSFQSSLVNVIRSDKSSILWAIVDKTKDEKDLKLSLAGIIGLMKCSPEHRAAEIGPIIVLPGFQGTFISSNAIGAVLKYLMDIPAEGGLGFRRAAWSANPDNQASVKVAERIGLKLEGIQRWTWCLPEGKEGREGGNDRGDANGRDSAILAICWDDWENGGKEHVEKLIERP